MVHRQADSRLLTNLIQQEKDYSKQVNQLLDCSCAALAALAAYAASSPPPVSHVIMELTGTLGAADAALKRYALGVDEWRETMRTLKDAEEEVGNIMRDREILVTRLIKASKSQKGGARESLLLSPHRFPSSSSLSLSTSGQNDSPSPPPSRPLSSSYSTSSKLAAAQTELQACEAHLASKERELEQKRCAAIRDGLGIRMKAMMDCGWVWNELGKEALRTLDQLRKPPDPLPQDEQFSRSDSRIVEGSRPFSDFSSIGPSQSVSQVNSMHNAPPPVSMAAVLNTGAFGKVMHEDDHQPERELTGPTEDQPQSQLQPALNGQQVVSDSSNGSSLSKLAATTTYKVETVTYAPAVPLFVAGKESAAPVTLKAESLKSDYSSIHVPPPHAIEGYTYGYPTAAPSGSKEEVLSPRSTPTTSPVHTPQRRSSFTSPPIISAFHTHKLERRITEEDVRRRSLGETSEKSDDSSDHEKKLLQEGKLEVVENPRFMSDARKREIEAEKEKEKAQRTAAEAGVSFAPEAAQRTENVTISKPVTADNDVVRTLGKEKKRLTLFHSGKDTTSTTRSPSRPSMHRAHGSDGHLSVSDAGKSNTSPSKGGFFGGIKSLFASRQLPSQTQTSSPAKFQDPPVVVESEDISDSEDESSKRVPSKRRGLFSSRTPEDKGQKGWETRTDKNLREITKAGSFDRDSERRPYQSTGVGATAVANVGLGTPSTIPTATTQRNRSTSEVGTSAVPAAPATVQGRKLKKRGPGAPATPGATTSDNENYFETRPLPHAAPLTVPRAPVNQVMREPAAPALVGAGFTMNDHRRSSSVDVTMGNRKSWTEDENGAMIVDLGRRRVASEVGAPAVAAQATAVAAENKPLKSAIRAPQTQAQHYQQPHHAHAPALPRPQPQATSTAAKSVPAPAVVHREYASDTGAAPSAPVVRKKSLTKKKPQPAESTVSTSALPPPVPASPLLSSLGPVVATPPARRASAKPTSTSTAPQPPAAATATLAGSKKATHPTVVGATIMPAGGKHPSGVLVSEPGWATQSHTQGGALSRNTSSASAGGTAARRKPTILGQGMGTSGEHRRAASLGPAAGASVAAPPASQHVKAASGGGTAVQPLAPAASLMSIVEDVSRVNREGWGRDSQTVRSTGGSQVPTGMIDVVKAPPPMGRKYYEAMGDQRTTTTQAAAPQVPLVPPPSTVSRTGMFEVTAPKSVFDQRESLAKATTTTAPIAPPVQLRQPQPQHHSHAPPVGPGKVPLRSALRTSRSPSPVITAPRAQASTATKPPPPPPPHVDGRLPWSGDNGSAARFTAAEKGKAPMRGPPDDESGGESNYETGDEMLDAQDVVGPDGRPKFVRRSSSGRRVQDAPAAPAVNGHAIGHEQRTKPAEPQPPRAAAPTVVGQPQSLASPQQPRRRKSVRVSLQPTFSPSPPAIEYDDEEEQKLHAPWAFGAERPIERERQPMVLQAPAPVYPQPAYTVASSHVDMWADSDEEDEEYLKAKRLLSRAAKKEKDVSRMVANRA